MRFGIWLSALALALTGCGKNLRPDPIPITAEAANYPTADGSSCKPFNGLMVCPVKKGDPLPALSFQGYYQGTITVDSERCGVHEKFRYTGPKQVPVPIHGVAEESCLVDFVIAHEWPKEDSSGLVIAPVKGRVWIVVSSHEVVYQIDKLPESLDAVFHIPAPEGDTQARVALESCGVSFDQVLPVQGGFIDIRLSDLIPIRPAGLRCAISGALVGSQKRIRLAWLFWVYDPRFSPLSVPALEEKSGKICVNADTAVSVIALDDQYTVDAKGCFKFDPSTKHTLRLLTVKGRILIGQWDGKEWKWTR